MTKRNIIFLTTSDLIEHPSNPRILEEAVHPVARSIEEFGFINPIIINEQNIILAGHARKKAAESLGIETVPTLKVSNLSKAQELAYLVADNRLSENASYDNNMLAQVLKSIDAMDYDATVTGFSSDEIEAFIDGATKDLDDLLGLNEDFEDLEPFEQENEPECNEKPNMKRISFFFNENEYKTVTEAIELVKSNSEGKISLGTALAEAVSHYLGHATKNTEEL